MERKIESIKWTLTRFRYKLNRWLWDFKYFISNKGKPVKNISIVVVGRNDNYGGDFSKRLETTIDWNYNHVPNAELIYVEWNPLPDKPSDTEWISKRYPNSRCFIVPNEIHKLYCENPKLPLMEYFAKNLGIREAGNDWVMLVNADVFLGFNVLHNLKHLNEKYVYGTHYHNILWNGEPLENRHIEDKTLTTIYFSASQKLDAVVGNFIMAHKYMWNKARGYDENLKNVRSGVDSNGLLQLFYHGAVPMALGDHYHLDHKESLIYGENKTHGSNEEMEQQKNIPYSNPDNWGLSDFKKVKTAERVWRLERI